MFAAALPAVPAPPRPVAPLVYTAIRARPWPLPLQAIGNASAPVAGGTLPEDADGLARALLARLYVSPGPGLGQRNAAMPGIDEVDAGAPGPGHIHARSKRANKGGRGGNASGPVRPPVPPPKSGGSRTSGSGQRKVPGTGRRQPVQRNNLSGDTSPLEPVAPKPRNAISMSGPAYGAAGASGHANPGTSAAGEAGHAAGARDSLLATPLKHELSRPLPGPPEREDKPVPILQRLPDPDGAMDTATTAPPSVGSGKGGVRGESPLPRVPASASWPDEADCLRVDDAQIAFALVRSRRYRPWLLHFCVPSAQVPWLKDLFNARADSDRGMGRWMASTLVGEPIAHTESMLQVRYYRSHDDIDITPPRFGHLRDGQRRFALLTLSLLDAPLHQEAHGWPLTWMGANTFRLLHHSDTGTDRGIYLAYFLRKTSGVCQGVKGGFLKVDVTDQGDYRVRDARHATAIVAPTLEALVASLEKLTGLRHEPASSDPLRSASVPATNLFVDEADVLASDGSGAHLPYNTALDPFTPVMIVVPGHAMPFGLYRGSYRWMADGEQVIYADEQGQGGTLRFGPAVAGRGERQLICATPDDRQFVARFGLQPGALHDPDAVMAQLGAAGFVNIPGHPLERGATSLDDVTRCAAPGPVPGSASAPAPVAEGRATALRLPTSQFQFDEGVLHYTDHDGTAGLLHFDTIAAGSSRRYWLVDRPGSAEALFAARHGLQGGKSYSDVDIRWALLGEGFEESAPAGAA